MQDHGLWSQRLENRLAPLLLPAKHHQKANSKWWNHEPDFEIIFLRNRRPYLRQSSDPSQDFLNFITTDYRNRLYIALLPRCQHLLLWIPQPKADSYRHRLSLSHHLQIFIDLSKGDNQQKNKNLQKLTELESSGRFFTALDSLANCIARFTSQLSLINILIVLPTALGLEVSLCIYRSGNTGTAGAVVTIFSLQKPHFHWSSTTFMFPITGRKRKIQSHPEQRWQRISKHFAGWHFLKSKTRTPFQRSEATPIPMAVLAAWEKRIISDDSNPAEILTLGCFLIATMASLRFRDLLRTNPDRLLFRGIYSAAFPGEPKPQYQVNPGVFAALSLQHDPPVNIGFFASLKLWNQALKWANNIAVKTGSQISSYPLGQIQSLSLHHALIIMDLRWSGTMPSAIGFNHRCFHQIKQKSFPLTVWNQPS